MVSLPLFSRSSYQNQQVPSSSLQMASTSMNNCEMPEYSNLPLPRKQASIAASAAAVAASASSFNSKRSRHSSLWSLQDEQDDQEGDGCNDHDDMVNYGNDPFGHNAEFPSQMMNSGMTMREERQSYQRHSASNEALN